jgi:ferredoxin
MKISIDADRCTGHGRCYSLAPDLFDSDDYGHGIVLQAMVSTELEERARAVVLNCPERAIELHEPDDG